MAFGSIYAITSSMRCVSEKYVCVCVCGPMELSNNHVHCKSKWCAMNGVFVRILHGWIQQFDADCVFVLSQRQRMVVGLVFLRTVDG